MENFLDFDKSITNKYPNSIIEIDKMSGKDFEEFIGQYLKEFKGYDVQYTEQNDHGLDIIAIKDDKRYGIQCKRYGPNTTIEESQLTKMQVGVKHYGISCRENNNPYLIVFTTATKDQVSQRGRNYIINNDIQVFYRDTIILILKEINDKHNREANNNNYENIAYDSTKQGRGSFKQNSKMVEFLKEERKKIAKYNNIDKFYLVYSDKTMGEIVENKPTSLDDLKIIKGLSNKNIELFGQYLIKKLNSFYKYEFPELYEEDNENNTESKKEANNYGKLNHEMKETTNKNNDEEFIEFLKNIRKRISEYNNLSPIYLVFSNETLDEIAQVKPKSVEELAGIKGIGEKKCEIFGKYLVNEINKYLSRNK